MKHISKRKYVQVYLPKEQYYTAGGRTAAIYHFDGFINDGLAACQDCAECDEFNKMIQELLEVDDGFRREWHKLSARYARVPQRSLLRAEYRRKRGKSF